MPVLRFFDSFDHYTTPFLGTKWDAAEFGAIDLSGTASRTGSGCCVITASTFGPEKVIPPTKFITFGGAVKVPISIDVLQILTGFSGGNIVRLTVQNDGSISLAGDGPVNYGSTAAGVFSFSQYNYLELAVAMDATNGSIVLRNNSSVVFSAANINTTRTGSSTAAAVQLLGTSNSGAGTTAWDDVYIADWTTTPSQPFYGPIRLFLVLPTADESPLQWTPNTGTAHWSLVNDVPPDGDTTYNFDQIQGHVDQYQYVATNLGGNAGVAGVQHTMYARVNGASPRVIGSVAGDKLGSASFALTIDYVFYKCQYDKNPITNLQWQIADFPFNFGPITLS